jgi:electron transfer flavoprotein beta subunit
VKCNAAQAGITDLSKCGLKGSPTVVKKVYAPSARATKAKMLTSTETSPDALADELVSQLFGQAPGLESDLISLASKQAQP